MRQTLIIAGKEVRDGMRNRWILATTLLLAAFALTLAFLGATPTGAVNVSPLAITIVSLSSLSIFLLPLIALLLSYDAIVGEVDRGTMALLLAYPVTRWQVVIGKFLGHLAILAFATVVGFGAAGAALCARRRHRSGVLARLRGPDGVVRWHWAARFSRSATSSALRCAIAVPRARSRSVSGCCSC